MEQTRADHVAWCKQRALEYIDLGDNQSAFASMISDMGKRDDCAVMPVLSMVGMMDMGNAQALRRWIEGFN